MRLFIGPSMEEKTYTKIEYIEYIGIFAYVSPIIPPCCGKSYHVEHMFAYL